MTIESDREPKFDVLSLYKTTHIIREGAAADGRVINVLMAAVVEDMPPFANAEYSLFKFGSMAHAARYGTLLAKLVAIRYPDFMDKSISESDKQDLVITSSG